MPESPKRAPLVEAMRYAQVGTMLIAPMLVLGTIGYVLDRRFETEPWLLLAGLVLGLATGFVNFFRLVLAPTGDSSKPGDRRR